MKTCFFFTKSWLNKNRSNKQFPQGIIQPSMRWLSHQLYPEGAGIWENDSNLFANLGPKENVKKHVSLRFFGEVGSVDLCSICI